jgi:hypothetical protein
MVRRVLVPTFCYIDHSKPVSHPYHDEHMNAHLRTEDCERRERLSRELNKDVALTALYVATAGVEGVSAQAETVQAFADAFTFEELKTMARKLRDARMRREG